MQQKQGPPRSSGTRYSMRTKLKVKRLYDGEWSLSDICSLPQMPSNIKVIRGWLTDQGVKIRPKQPIYPRKEILAKLRKGVSRADLQEEYGCSFKYLSNLMNGKIKKKLKKKVKRRSKVTKAKQPRKKQPKKTKKRSKAQAAKKQPRKAAKRSKVKVAKKRSKTKVAKKRSKVKATKTKVAKKRRKK